MEQAIFTNMCMVYDGNGNVLVQDRADKDFSGITFPGGHVELGESFVKSVIREVFEEAGLTIDSPQLCGIKQFQTSDNARYVVILYKTNKFSGTIQSSSDGEVFWMALEDVPNSNLASSMLNMLRVFLNEDLTEHYYYKETDNTTKENYFNLCQIDIVYSQYNKYMRYICTGCTLLATLNGIG